MSKLVERGTPICEYVHADLRCTRALGHKGDHTLRVVQPRRRHLSPAEHRERTVSPASTGVPQLPGFVESLRLLVRDERYSLTDIAMMFGVSRERIRQLCRVHGIDQDNKYVGLFAVRMWDDERNRFVPMSKGLLAEERRLAHSRETQAAIRARIAERRAHIIEVVRDLRARVPHPSWCDLLRVLQPDRKWEPAAACCPIVLSMWGHYGDIRGTLREFCRETGWVSRAHGTRGHDADCTCPACVGHRRKTPTETNE